MVYSVILEFHARKQVKHQTPNQAGKINYSLVLETENIPKTTITDIGEPRKVITVVQ